MFLMARSFATCAWYPCIVESWLKVEGVSNEAGVGGTQAAGAKNISGAGMGIGPGC